MASHAQERSFLNDVVTTDILDKAVEWIGKNMEPHEVFSESSLKESVRASFNPEDVFNTSELKQWAEENGYSEPE